jgi:hypothetical protein
MPQGLSLFLMEQTTYMEQAHVLDFVAEAATLYCMNLPYKLR